MLGRTRPKSAGLSRAGVWLAWATLLVPTLVSAGVLIEGDTERLDQARNERIGVAMIARVDTAVSDADEYRFASGASARRTAARRVAIDLAELRGYDASLPASLDLRAQVARLRERWRDLTRDGAAGNDDAVSPWMHDLAAEIPAISDGSRITYDPRNDTINLGDALAMQYATSAERFARLASFSPPRGRERFTIAERFLAARLTAEALAAEGLGATDMSEAFDVTPSLAVEFRSDVADLDRASRAYADRIDRHFQRESALPEATLIEPGRDVVRHHHALAKRIAAALDRALVDRIAVARRLVVATALGAVAIAMISFAIVAICMRALALAAQLDRIASEQARERAIAAVERDLITAEERFRVTFEQVPLGVLIVDADLEAIEANPALASLVNDLASLIDDDREHFARALAGSHIEPFERRYARCDGTLSWAEVALRGVTSGADGERFVLGTFRDISESKALSERLVYDATHDALTGLPNRAAFSRALADVLARYRAGTGDAFAVLYLDLDGFKLVNDSVGHQAGDALLVETARRLRSSVRSGDVVCRIGGDEFAVLLPASDAVDSDRLAGRIVASLQEPVAFDVHRLAVRASVGVVVPRPDLIDAEDVLRDADTAMYHAKSLGGGRHVTFDASMHESARRRLHLRSDLREAIEREAIAVVYQPIFDLHTMRVRGFEALARWMHPTYGTIGPDEFIPIAEESGTIDALGRLVLRTACAQLAIWRREERSGRAWTINVNVAASQILGGSIVEDVRSALADTGVPAERITLEITESVLLDDVVRANETLAALRRIGSRICVDDFGTGYSSLQYLQHLPLDGIKLDRSFVSDGSDGLASEPIITMLVTLSRMLGLGVVVEGIETQTQLRALVALGCTTGQGYIFSRPVQATEAALLARGLHELPATG